MKECRYCSENYPEEFFEVANTVNGVTYRRRKCKFCKQKTQNTRRGNTKKAIDSFKNSLKCSNCGISDFRIMEFHHSDPNEKEYNVSNMYSWSLERIFKEIEKCIPLCANCHRIVHWEIRNGT